MELNQEIDIQEQIFCLQGKTAMITGGSRNIDAGIAYDLSKRGADVSPTSALHRFTNHILDHHNPFFTLVKPRSKPDHQSYHYAAA
jgi:hypothetical protein